MTAYRRGQLAAGAAVVLCIGALFAAAAAGIIEFAGGRSPDSGDAAVAACEAALGAHDDSFAGLADAEYTGGNGPDISVRGYDSTSGEPVGCDLTSSDGRWVVVRVSAG